MRFKVLTLIAVAATLMACNPIEKDDPKFNGPSLQQGRQPSHDPKNLSDGTWLVGSEIEVGTYKTIAPENTKECIWSRVSDLSGTTISIIARGVVEKGKLGYMSVIKTDRAVEFNGGCTWVKVK